MAYEGRASEIASASGVSCRVRRPMWQPIGYPAAPTHPPHAIGTGGPLGDQITSMEARFYFHPENPLNPFGHAKVTPFPQPCLGAYKGTLWGPVSEIAGTQVPVAGNSNLKLVRVWTS